MSELFRAPNLPGGLPCLRIEPETVAAGLNSSIPFRAHFGRGISFHFRCRLGLFPPPIPPFGVSFRASAFAANRWAESSMAGSASSSLSSEDE